ncbi:hypothetical protein B0H17DRAFT_530043 [Mycena rosella]|uniref:Uncharacterized protein n=1 Tax=Mycena rosella TaxID=1033263 RepID=A0AAD7MA53_MYCRO|nr:hypothetical protein B0H17DRAFT_530043 [Mycena rosella]
MPPLRMNDLVWGATHEELPDINPSDSTAFLQKLGTSPLWSVLGWTDLFLPPFRAASESTAIASESSASVGIPSHQALRVVLEDLDWVEDLEALARERWNLTDDDRQSGAHPDWDSTSLAMVRNSDLIRQFYTLGPDDIVLEESEADTDMRCRTETFLLNPLYKLVAPPPLPTFSFTSKAQASTKITGGGIVRPDVDFIYAQIEPQRTKNLLRAGNKTVLVQYKHATEIQRMIGIPKAAGWTSLAARGICTQVRTKLKN